MPADVRFEQCMHNGAEIVVLTACPCFVVYVLTGTLLVLS